MIRHLVVCMLAQLRRGLDPERFPAGFMEWA